MDQPQWREDLFTAKWAEIDKAVEAARQAKMPVRKPDSSLRRLPTGVTLELHRVSGLLRRRAGRVS
jgi:hypothetical protein